MFFTGSKSISKFKPKGARWESFRISKEISEEYSCLKGWHYTADKGWLWTDLVYYPIVYSNAGDAWIHYDQGTSNPWHYYNYSTQEWFEWE